MAVQFSTVPSIGSSVMVRVEVGGWGEVMMDDSTEILSQSFLREVIVFVSSS